MFYYYYSMLKIKIMKNIVKYIYCNKVNYFQN